MATKDSMTKHDVVASNDISINKEENVEINAAGTKNVVVTSEHSPVTKEDNVGASSNSRTSEKEDQKMKKVVAPDSTEEEDDEKETGVDIGISLEKLNLGPKKKLLVIPIGGFLVHRAHRRRPKTIPKKLKPDFCSGNFMIYKRPFCQEFLRFCFERFEVGIWSSAMELVSQF